MTFRLFLVLATAQFVTASVVYNLVEEGEILGRAFQRFLAYDADTGQPITTQEWTDAILLGETIAPLNAILKKAPYAAFYFEVAPMLDASSQPFELVLVDAPSLAKRRPRFRSFAEPCHISTEQSTFGCVFSNLSGDATLVVPKPSAGLDDTTYTHLANFLRKAPEEQVEALWKMVAQAYKDHWTGPATVWLSTAGNGVPWLHFRLDRNPKYYRYTPFKQAPYLSVSVDSTEL